MGPVTMPCMSADSVEAMTPFARGPKLHTVLKLKKRCYLEIKSLCVYKCR